MTNVAATCVVRALRAPHARFIHIGPSLIGGRSGVVGNLSNLDASKQATVLFLILHAVSMRGMQDTLL